MFVEHLAIRKTLCLTAPTQEHQVQMFPHMTEGCVGILIENSTVRAESNLLSLPTNSKGLPFQASPVMEVRQQELLVGTHGGGHKCCWHYSR